MSSQTRDRIESIDAARGTAMLFVCLSHFAWVYLRENRADGELLVATHVALIASPTFMAISGLMLGYLYTLQRHNFDRIQQKLVDRGLFLVTIGHVLIDIAHFQMSGGVRLGLRWGFITDAIGVSIILGSLLIPRLAPPARLTLSAGVYALGWVLMRSWHPVGMPLEVIKETLFGPFGKQVYSDVFPVVPWFSLYLAASCVGERMGALWRARDERGVHRLLSMMSLGLLAIGVVLWGAATVASSSGLVPADTLLHELAWPFKKLPPSPAYVALFGGLGLLMLRILFTLERKGAARPYLRVAAMVGRTSLFAFIAQYYLYYTLLSWLRLPFSPIWPLYFLLSLAALVGGCFVWDRRGFNRYITVGYAPSRASAHARAVPRESPTTLER